MNWKSILARVSGFGVLFAVTGLVPGTALADAPAHNVPLSHATPGEIIALMHWNEPGSMPRGVQSITADKATNSLRVVGTQDGVAEVEKLVSFVDIPVRQVRIDVRYVLAREADLASYEKKDAVAARKPASSDDFLLNASAPLVARMLDDLAKKNDVVASPRIQTVNNTAATLNLHGRNVVTGFPEVEGLTFSVSPRVNSDDTLTLPLNLSVTIGGPGAAGEVPDGQSAEQVFNVVRTVKDGETFVAANLAHTGSGADARVLLAFVTPHIGSLR